MRIMSPLTLMMITKVVTAHVIHPRAAELSTRTPSVHYIHSRRGNFFVASGKTLPTESASLTIKAKDSCHCRMMCLTQVNCVAWSFVSSECRMADKGPTAYEVQEYPNATFYFMEGSIDGSYSFKADGLLYVQPPFVRVYAMAKRFCERIPGHRLGIYKTLEQLSFLEDYFYPSSTQESMTMHLEKSPSGMIWGDGTPFAASEVGQNSEVVIDNDDSLSIFVVHNSKFNDVDPTKSRQFMCQANPLGVEW